MELRNFVADTDLEREGVWFDLGQGFEIKIARQSTPEYRAALKRVTKPFRRQLMNDSLPDEKLQQLLGEVYAMVLVKDWKGLEENGVPVEFSPKKAKEILTNPAYHELRDLVGELSQDATRFREDEIEDMVGN